MDFRWALGSGVCEVLWESVRQRHEWDLQILCASISAPLGDIEQPGIPGGGGGVEKRAAVCTVAYLSSKV